MTKRQKTMANPLSGRQRTKEPWELGKPWKAAKGTRLSVNCVPNGQCYYLKVRQDVTFSPQIKS